MPPPTTACPLLIARPEIVTISPEAISKTRLKRVFSTANFSAPGPLIVRFLFTSSSPLLSSMEPETPAALMLSPFLAPAMFWRGGRGPLSLVFVTVMVFACTFAPTSHNALKQPASRIPHLFTGAEFSVNLVASQAGKRNRQTLWSRWRRADFGHISDAKLFCASLWKFVYQGFNDSKGPNPGYSNRQA